jgi:hypothetical protein
LQQKKLDQHLCFAVRWKFVVIAAMTMVGMGMELMLLRQFEQQVLNQCEFVLMAANEINAALKARHLKRVFFGLQNLLTAAANISKALWGQAGRFALERKDLRDSIGVADDSPLRRVTMRNHFEHFDERLDKWWRESGERHVMIDFCVMPKSAVQIMDPLTWFRVFDPVSANVYFWSEEFNIQELITEVQKILPRLQAEVSKGLSVR